MMWKGLSHASLLLVVLVICSVYSLPVLGMQSASILSYGTVNYPTIPRLHVEGTQIKDQLGRRVYLKGVNYDSAQWWDSNSAYNENQFIYMQNWGCTAVRVNIEAFSLEAGIMSNPAFLIRLDNVISWAQAHGLYVILDGWHLAAKCPHGETRNYVDHYMTVDWTWNDWFNWWTTLATRYKGKGVIYDLMNEPLHWNLADHQAKMRQCIDNIRAIDPDAVCMVEEVGSGGWDTMNFLFEQSYPISRSNVIYSCHFYGYHFSDNSQSAIRQRLGNSGAYAKYANWMLTNGRCVQIGEFGGGYNNDPNAAWSSWQATFLQNAMTVLNADGYSGYTAWRWVNFGWSCEKLLADWNGNPTPYGTVLQEGLKQ